ncbi:P-loop containing nucleoside triphosphate hydrolase protein [Delitschia confertaspora ATCC 74209]|uniref:P-loop containing nucleoside triphosphate hydrolase protein n=1 Tax=Delitschia confertaspora ATCC 74209 TaxID=1513339 RepID=A0A9P4JF32_9PLEO|nr:P-loop containing nucleoside triphosphate hydrolase protein [Delitschia confertaspora ATCC 74209]
MAPSTTLCLAISPQARVSYIALSTIGRRSFQISSKHKSDSGGSRFYRTDLGNHGYSGEYEPGLPMRGPLGTTSDVGAPPFTPKDLKQRLDEYVVGQERAKKVLSVAVYNHYQRVQEICRQEDEQERLKVQAQRRQQAQRHPVEDEFPGQQPTMKVYSPPSLESQATEPLHDYSPPQIDKSNVLLLGPSGVGKTLMAKTLARTLDLPFSMSDCTPFTQAGYIGEDAEVCVHRLLAAANYDVAAAEQGIICLDEIDKIATAKMSHGKDVSGEGVQQALLKIIEGTTLQIQAKPERRDNGRSPGNLPNSLGGGPGPGPPPPGSGGKGEVFNVRTDNILFICTGAFVGLHKMILDRISKGSIGFGASVRGSDIESGSHETMMKGEDALFKKHLPFYVSPSQSSDLAPHAKPPTNTYNMLDLVTPADLQKYGMIPELVGRIPLHCALSALDEESLVRVLTEPKDSLIRQYERLFQLSGIELRFTSGALREIAKSAKGMGTGARGLRTVLERLLGECQFETPGSNTKHILVTQAVAQLKGAPVYFARGQRENFQRWIEEEDRRWQREIGGEVVEGNVVSTFEQYRRGATGAM